LTTHRGFFRLESLEWGQDEVMADSIHIKFPDGGSKEFPKGTTAMEAAKSISPRLAEAALAAKRMAI